MKNADSPAMPVSGFCRDSSGALCGEFINDAGLTKRETMAMNITCAMISAPIGKFNHASVGEIIDSAIRDADLFFDKLERACPKT